MSAIYLPATVALLIKFAIIYFARKGLFKSTVTRFFTVLLVSLTVSNVLELASFYFVDRLDAALILLRLYYISILLTLVFSLQISVAIISPSTETLIKVFNYAIAFVMGILALFTDHFIMGGESIGYTATRIPGHYYLITQVYALVMITATIGTGIYGYKRARVHYHRIQSMYVLLSVFFLALPLVIAIALMFFGVKINAAVILPIGVSLFLVSLTYGLNADGLYDIRVWIPGTVMFELHRSLHKEYMLNFDGTEMSAKERIEAHEKRYLIHVLIQTDGNQKEAARMLDVSESTISMKRKKYGI